MKRIIVIGGPTASGKTALAIRCAVLLGTEIISADSRQCYTEMTIGTAKPSAEELAAVKHHFINSHHLPFRVTAGEFAAYNEPILKNLLQTKGAAVIAGGTGLYIHALLKGLDTFPEIPEAIREQLKAEQSGQGSLDRHLEELKLYDPEWYDRIDRHNHRRILRALEVIRTSGMPYSSFLTGPSQQWDAEISYYYLDPGRDQLYTTIASRVENMFREGLEEEVRSLQKWEHHPALATVGYRELFGHFHGKYDLEQAKEHIIRHTRNYAKRQWTWFRNQGEFSALDPTDKRVKTGRLHD